MISIQKIFDKVLSSEEGECIAIKCSSFEEMERLRIQLYRERMKLRKAYKELADVLNISRKSEGDKWVIYLSKAPEIPEDRVFFISKAGRVKPFVKEVAHGTGKRSAVEQAKRKREGSGKVSRSNSKASAKRKKASSSS